MKSPKSAMLKVLPALNRFISLDILMMLTNQKVIFPFYHAVSDEKIIHITHLYKVKTVARFVKDLDLLLKYYHPVSHEDLLESFRKDKPLQRNCFLLSFDDGLREFHDIIAPVLVRKGIPAVCFLNPAFIDNKALFYRYKASILTELFGTKEFDIDVMQIPYSRREVLDELAADQGYDFSEYLLDRQPYLTGSQVEKLISQGFGFGAHSIDHPEYRFISEEEQIRQTRESIQEVCTRFGLNYRLFSFPFTDFGVSATFFEMIFDPLHPIADITFGGAGLKKDIRSEHLQRIPFEEATLNAKEILTSEYIYYMMKAIAGKNRIKR
jgi:peptidoglycan/xylan/chitin deacetylase (PgdA/CDA1 family)